MKENLFYKKTRYKMVYEYKILFRNDNKPTGMRPWYLFSYRTLARTQGRRPAIRTSTLASRRRQGETLRVP